MVQLAMDAPSPLSLPRTVALVGLMGAGKSAIGRRLAARLALPFIDADREIESAAGCTIEEIEEIIYQATAYAGFPAANAARAAATKSFRKQGLID